MLARRPFDPYEGSLYSQLIHDHHFSALKALVDIAGPAYVAALKNTTEVYTLFVPTDKVRGHARRSACAHRSMGCTLHACL
jgi:hypothetical protein